MRSVWKGSISFGLVTIPVSLANATTEKDGVKFRMLRKKDLSPIQYKRVAQVDQKEVPWAEIVKGYEYEKGKFVVFEESDFDKIDLESTDSIHILDFVDAERINPNHFYKPYFIEPQKGGGPAYSLLRDALDDTGKTGIAKVVLRDRQHLAAVRPAGTVLVLELMRFAEELVSPTEVSVPEQKKSGARELQMAKTLIEQMTAEWDPEKYRDEYTDALLKLVDQKIKAGGKALPDRKTKSTPTNVVDLVSVLQQSLNAAGKSKSKTRKKAAA